MMLAFIYYIISEKSLIIDGYIFFSNNYYLNYKDIILDLYMIEFVIINSVD